MEGDSVHRPLETLWRSRIFFFGHLVAEDQMPEVVLLDVLESYRCVFIHLFVLK
jgi:hypothetical protein